MTQKTRITATIFCNDYLEFGSRNRVVAVTELLRNWEHLEYNDQVLVGGKVLQEYGAAVEELFVYAYAVFRQCNFREDENRKDDSVFLECVVRYKQKDIESFLRRYTFTKDFFTIYKLPDVSTLAQKWGQQCSIVENAISDVATTLEDMKNEFVGRKLRIMYNKLKHPFLVLSPQHSPFGENYVLPILSDPEDDSDVGTAYPATVTKVELDKLANNILSLCACTKTLIKLMLLKFEIEYPNQEL